MSAGSAGRPRVLAIVQAGGKGSRMDVLTRERVKPALPFGGQHRLVDITLSNLAHSGISDVWVSVQYQAGSLDQHLAGGRPWDLDRTRGGMRRMVPEESAGAADQSGFSHGNADDLYRLRDQIAVQAPDVVVVSSADHVFRLDLRDVVDAHLAAGAECTLVTSEVSRQEAANNVVVVLGQDGAVTRVVDKPDDPPTTTVAIEVFAYDAPVLLAQLEALRRRTVHQADDDDTGLGDVADVLLPALVRRGRVRTFPLAGYWRDVGRPEAYLQAHRDLLRGSLDVFDDPAWPVLGQLPTGAPARVAGDGTVVDGLLSTGCVVRGTVERSVLGPGVAVHPGARVVDSVLMGGVVVETGATVATAVVDEQVRIGRGATVGVTPAATRLRAEDVTMVGRDSVVRGGTTVPAGGRMEPGSTT
ncbi:glucose-1-phosphate adenylyltransferase family protein [Ornithinimicrobium sediminis]|uniref:glucose-1-phosphate adenylyltransferase family protein n=1 Tax=Ornithinimicrobium sediminis TaxID=2904603 RepID=UPI001E28458E|nr:sugar phosphate nucleotidyltransferase [Ornithinimicrobium sediminis]MCE0486996.1 NTP transferase domain-containing protein [Ornithinimicrobium sediminis]